MLPAPDPLFPEEPDRARFDTVLGWIASWFNVLPLDEAVSCLERGSLPERAAAITFDDGYADNYTVALPVLKHHGLGATFFIATAYLDGGCMWNDQVITAIRTCTSDRVDLGTIGLGSWSLGSARERRTAIDAIIGRLKYADSDHRGDLAKEVVAATRTETPGDLMLSSQQVRELRAAGMGIGAHTVTHPILARVSLEVASREVAEGSEMLRGLIGDPIEFFAFPNGKPGIDYLREHVDLLRGHGFRAAVSTSAGVAGQGADIMQLPRFTPWDRKRARFGLRALGNLWSAPIQLH